MMMVWAAAWMISDSGFRVLRLEFVHGMIQLCSYNPNAWQVILSDHCDQIGEGTIW